MAGSDDVGANPNDAGSKGENTVTVAETFKGLRSSFASAIDLLNSAAADKTIKGGFSAFGEQHVSGMQEVQTHGERIGGNIQAGSTRITETDSESATTYYGMGLQYQEEAAEAAGDYDTPMEGLLNRHVNGGTDRYVP